MQVEKKIDETFRWLPPTTCTALASEPHRDDAFVSRFSTKEINIWHNTQRAWVVGYAAHARLAVYRIGLAWQTGSGAGCAPEATQDGCAPELTREAFYNPLPMLCRWDRIARNLTASRERECEHPQFIEHEKVNTWFITEWSVGRGGRGNKQCRPPSPRKMQPKQNAGKHAQFGTKWWLILQCAHKRLRWMVWLEWSCLAVNMC